MATPASGFCEERLRFSFGLIADVQHADADDGFNYKLTSKRFYRNSLNLLKKAVNDWKNAQNQIDFAIQLGDLIDGISSRNSKTEQDIQNLLSAVDDLHCPMFHVWGNHEFYNFSREELLAGPLNSKTLANSFKIRETSNQNGNHSGNERYETSKEADEEDTYYFSFQPDPSYLFLFLDTYDVSYVGYPENHTKRQLAFDILKKNNPNSNWLCPDDLEDRRYVKFNGGIGTKQLLWLDQKLESAQSKDQKVLIFTHVPLYRHATSTICLAWNSEEILNVLYKYSCVVACFYGHEHKGGFSVDRNGIYHWTLRCVLECNPDKDENAFATINAFSDRLEVIGHGIIESKILKFK